MRPNLTMVWHVRNRRPLDMGIALTQPAPPLEPAPKRSWQFGSNICRFPASTRGEDSSDEHRIRRGSCPGSGRFDRHRIDNGVRNVRPPLPPAVETPASVTAAAVGWRGGAGNDPGLADLTSSHCHHGFANSAVTPMPPLRQTLFYVLLMSLLTFSALMYLIARQGAMRTASRNHQRVPRADIDKHFDGSDSSLTVIVPSYAEDPKSSAPRCCPRRFRSSRASA